MAAASGSDGRGCARKGKLSRVAAIIVTGYAHIDVNGHGVNRSAGGLI